MGKISLKNINKIYPNKVQAVYDFNLEIEDGELIVLVGPSGCGKTTTLRMIAGLEAITSGTLSMDGVVLNNTAPKDRDMAMVFQNYALYAHMSVYRNMAFSLLLRKENSDFIHRRVMKAAKILELVPYLNRLPKQLSGGQRQRVALGRAIVRDPKCFLLDEPLSNLDAKLRGSMRKELTKLHQLLKTTMIYVTHDQVEAMTLADRIVVMKDGWVQQIGPPKEIYDFPCNTFVATFIGTPPMNLIKGLVTNDGFISIGENNLKLTAQNLKQLKNHINQEVIIGIRPEHFTFDICRDNNYEITLKADIVEILGPEELIHSQIENTKIIAKVKTCDIIKPHSYFKIGIDMDKILFFDSSTKKRIE